MLGDIRAFQKQFHFEAVAHALHIVERIAQAFGRQDDGFTPAYDAVRLACRGPLRTTGEGLADEVRQHITLNAADGLPVSIKAFASGQPGWRLRWGHSLQPWASRRPALVRSRGSLGLRVQTVFSEISQAFPAGLPGMQANG